MATRPLVLNVLIVNFKKKRENIKTGALAQPKANHIFSNYLQLFTQTLQLVKFFTVYGKQDG